MTTALFSIWDAGVAALPFEWARYEFMRVALLAVLLISPLLGALGTVLLINEDIFYEKASRIQCLAIQPVNK